MFQWCKIPNNSVKCFSVIGLKTDTRRTCKYVPVDTPCMGLGSQFVVLDTPQKGWHMFASQNAGLEQSGKYYRPEYAPWPAEQHSCTHHSSWLIWSMLYQTA
jgi:hypothetical protein